jgi:hypothetical protein
VFVCLATLASRTAWLAAVAMAVAGFGVIFAGVASSVLAGATTALLLAFILPVSLAAPASAVRHCGVRPLVRVHADHHCHHQHAPSSSFRGIQEPRRACLITVLALVPLSSHAAARPSRLAPRSKARPREC